MKLVANFPDFSRPGSHLLLWRTAGAAMDWTELTLMSPGSAIFPSVFCVWVQELTIELESL